MSKLSDNVKVGLYVVSVVLPLVDAVMGAIRGVSDMIRRLQGKKTSVVLAVEDHVRKQVEDVVREMDKKLKSSLDENEQILQDRIQRGQI